MREVIIRFVKTFFFNVSSVDFLNLSKVYILSFIVILESHLFRKHRLAKKINQRHTSTVWESLQMMDSPDLIKLVIYEN